MCDLAPGCVRESLNARPARTLLWFPSPRPGIGPHATREDRSKERGNAIWYGNLQVSKPTAHRTAGHCSGHAASRVVRLSNCDSVLSVELAPEFEAIGLVDAQTITDEGPGGGAARHRSL